MLYESIPFAFLSIIILNKYLVKNFYGNHQKFTIFICIFVTFIFEFFFVSYKLIKKEAPASELFLLYIFNIFYFLFIGYKLSILTYLNKVCYVNAYEFFAFEGVGYFIIIFLDLIFCKLFYNLDTIKNKGGNHYEVKGKYYKHFNFYLCRNIITFFCTYLFYLIICLNNQNNYIICDIISKFIYFITFKLYRTLNPVTYNNKENNYYITLVLNFIVLLSCLIFDEIIIINFKIFYKDTIVYLEGQEKKEILELNNIEPEKSEINNN